MGFGELLTPAGARWGAAGLFAGSNYYELLTEDIGTTDFGFWDSTVWKYIGDRGLRDGARYIDEDNLDADRSLPAARGELISEEIRS